MGFLSQMPYIYEIAATDIVVTNKRFLCKKGIITIKDNAITACAFKTYEENGTLKDENYGMADGEIKNQDYYNKAQKAIKGSEAYAKEIIGKINPDEVDSISGATYSHNQFTDAVYDALDKAAE